MTEWQLNTPVALIVFNRPHTTRRVFELLRQVKPPALFVIADGPRATRQGEAESCAATRAIFEQVDWDCEVRRDFAATNLGCGWRPASGISWVFEQVPEAIILEDDCLPHPSFFRYCEELLVRYREDERVVHIGGSNFLFGQRAVAASYYFSRYTHCWGWATWRRAWRHFDYDLQGWSQTREVLRTLFPERDAARFWIELYDEVYAGSKAHVWDYQWLLACWLQGGLSIVPRVNLVSNIGFGADATHTFAPELALKPVLQRFGVAPDSSLGKLARQLYGRLASSRFAAQPVEALEFPLQHPRWFVRDVAADALIQRQNYQGGAWAWGKRKLKKWLLPS